MGTYTKVTQRQSQQGAQQSHRTKQSGEEKVTRMFTLMKTQDWVEMFVFFDNVICPTISASGVSLLVIMSAVKQLILTSVSSRCMAQYS